MMQDISDPENQQFFRQLLSSQKTVRRYDLVHSFCIVGLKNEKEVDQKKLSFSPQMCDSYPPEATDQEGRVTENFLYLQSIQSICFMDIFESDNTVKLEKAPSSVQIKDLLLPNGKTFHLLNYTITDGAGKQMFLSSLLFKDISGQYISPRAIVLVSEQPLFQLLS